MINIKKKLFLNYINTDKLVLDNQLKHIYNSSVRIQNVVYRTCQKWCMMQTNGERGRERKREYEESVQQRDMMMTPLQTLKKIFKNNFSSKTFLLTMIKGRNSLRTIHR